MASFANATSNLSRLDRLGLIGSILPLLGAAVAFVFFAGPIETWTIAERLASRSPVAYHDDLVLVGLDERLAERLAPGDPTPKGYLASVVRAAAASGASVIALDFRLGPLEAQEPGFEELAAAIAAARADGVAVVLPTLLASRGSGVDVVYAPDSSLLRHAVTGYVSFIADGPHGASPFDETPADDSPSFSRLHYLRPLRVDRESEVGNVAISFPLAAVAAHEGLLVDPPSRPAVLSSGRAAHLAREVGVVSEDVSNAHAVTAPPQLLDYAGPAPGPGLTYLSADKLIQTGGATHLRDRLVLVASVYPNASGEDQARTPYGTVRGGILLLHAMDTLLRRPRYWEPSPLVTALLTLFAGLLALAAWGLPSVWGPTALGSAGLLYVFSAYAAVEWGFLLPMAWPVGVAIFASMVGFIFQDALRDNLRPAWKRARSTIKSAGASVSRMRRPLPKKKKVRHRS